MAQFHLQFAFLLGLIALSTFTTARPYKTFIIVSSSNVTSSNVTFTYFIPIEQPSFSANTFSNRGPFEFSGHDFTSLHDRIKDILSVVVALLFGVGCGAVTAGTMCLVWSICFARDENCDSHDDYVDKIKNPKKLGYVKVSNKDIAA